MQYKAAIAVAFLAASELVAGHGAIVRATGNMGGEGSAIGIDESTPRDGTRRQPFQRDATRFKGEAAGSCGETIGAGTNSVESGVRAVMATNGDTLPQVSAGGSVEMTLHQVNGDGAGPYTCMLDTTGTGSNWAPIRVMENVPGRRGNSRARATDFTIRAQIPEGTTCTGSMAGQDNLCMVRCQNPARAGPFGGCVPVQMVEKATTAKPKKAAPADDADDEAPAKSKSKSTRKEKRAVKNSGETGSSRASSGSSKASSSKSAPATSSSSSGSRSSSSSSRQNGQAEDLDEDPNFIAELRADGEEI